MKQIGVLQSIRLSAYMALSMFILVNTNISVAALKDFLYFKVTFTITYALSEFGLPVFTLPMI